MNCLIYRGTNIVNVENDYETLHNVCYVAPSSGQPNIFPKTTNLSCNCKRRLYVSHVINYLCRLNFKKIIVNLYIRAFTCTKLICHYHATDKNKLGNIFGCSPSCSH